MVLRYVYTAEPVRRIYVRRTVSANSDHSVNTTLITLLAVSAMYDVIYAVQTDYRCLCIYVYRWCQWIMTSAHGGLSRPVTSLQHLRETRPMTYLTVTPGHSFCRFVDVSMSPALSAKIRSLAIIVIVNTLLKIKLCYLESFLLLSSKNNDSFLRVGTAVYSSVFHHYRLTWFSCIIYRYLAALSTDTRLSCVYISHEGVL